MAEKIRDRLETSHNVKSNTIAENTEKSDVKITVIDYVESGYEEYQVDVENIEDIAKYKATPSITWINFEGALSVETIRALGEMFAIHKLTLEDVFSREQRPKKDIFEEEGYIYIVIHNLGFDENSKEVKKEQISIITSYNIVITFCEFETKIFDSVIGRIKKDGKIRKYASDYLTYALIDVIVDNYFDIIEKMDDHIFEIEEAAFKSTDVKVVEDIKNSKTQLTKINLSVKPLIEVFSSISKTDSKLIRKSTKNYYRDIYDHVVRIEDMIETERENLSDIFSVYESNINLKQNEIMKILTIISTIFIPLTFIAGVYGMNFVNMPELEWKYGYYFSLSLMGIICVIIIYKIRKMKWI